MKDTHSMSYYTPFSITHLLSDRTYTNINARFWTAARPTRMFPLVPKVIPAALVGIKIQKPLNPPPKFGMMVLTAVVPVSSTISVFTLIVAADARVDSLSLLVVPGNMLYSSLSADRNVLTSGGIVNQQHHLSNDRCYSRQHISRRQHASRSSELES